MMEWEFIEDPTEPGWYPVLVCYDPAEGVFPRAAYWDENKWDQKDVSGHGSKRESKESAQNLAYDNDPDRRAR